MAGIVLRNIALVGAVVLALVAGEEVCDACKCASGADGCYAERPTTTSATTTTSTVTEADTTVTATTTTTTTTTTAWVPDWCRDPEFPFKDLPGATDQVKGMTCQDVINVFTSCEPDVVAASPYCDETCKAAPNMLLIACPQSCGVECPIPANCMDPDFPFKDLPGATDQVKGMTCQDVVNVFTSCEPDVVAASPYCDETCKAAPNMLQIACPRTCDTPCVTTTTTTTDQTATVATTATTAAANASGVNSSRRLSNHSSSDLWCKCAATTKDVVTGGFLIKFGDAAGNSTGGRRLAALTAAVVEPHLEAGLQETTDKTGTKVTKCAEKDGGFDTEYEVPLADGEDHAALTETLTGITTSGATFDSFKAAVEKSATAAGVEGMTISAPPTQTKAPERTTVQVVITSATTTTTTVTLIVGAHSQGVAGLLLGLAALIVTA